MRRPPDTPTVAALSGRLAVERLMMARSRPHGVVARDQLLAAGIGPRLIDARVSAGWLRPMHRGIYAVGPIQSVEAPEAAAVLACGEGAALSHGSAASLWRVLRRQHRAPVHVTVPGGRYLRRARHPDPSGPSTATRRGDGAAPHSHHHPRRTLLDLAAILPARDLEQAIAQAERTYAGTQRRLLALLARYPVRPGTPKLRELLDGSRSPALTRSEAEERFLALVRKAGLPTPETNVVFHGYELDFLWRAERLAVEIDGWAFHGDRAAFEADRRRDADLAAGGIQVMRVTWRHVMEEPEATLVRVVRALAARA